MDKVNRVCGGEMLEGVGVVPGRQSTERGSGRVTRYSGVSGSRGGGSQSGIREHRRSGLVSQDDGQ